jgi:hydrogenase-4 component F
MASLPLSGGLFLAGFLAVTGSPPFGLFLSELTILRGIFASGSWLVGALFLVLLATIFIGFGATVLAVTQGEAVEPTLHFKDRLLLVAPPLVFLAAVLFLGLYLPPSLRALLEEAAALLEVCR